MKVNYESQRGNSVKTVLSALSSGVYNFAPEDRFLEGPDILESKHEIKEVLPIYP